MTMDVVLRRLAAAPPEPIHQSDTFLLLLLCGNGFIRIHKLLVKKTPLPQIIGAQSLGKLYCKDFPFEPLCFCSLLRQECPAPLSNPEYYCQSPTIKRIESLGIAGNPPPPTPCREVW